jgi:hypothetical protein
MNSHKRKERDSSTDIPHKKQKFTLQDAEIVFKAFQYHGENLNNFEQDPYVQRLNFHPQQCKKVYETCMKYTTDSEHTIFDHKELIPRLSQVVENFKEDGEYKRIPIPEPSAVCSENSSDTLPISLKIEDQHLSRIPATPMASKQSRMRPFLQASIWIDYLGFLLFLAVLPIVYYDYTNRTISNSLLLFIVSVIMVVLHYGTLFLDGFSVRLLIFVEIVKLYEWAIFMTFVSFSVYFLVDHAPIHYGKLVGVWKSYIDEFTVGWGFLLFPIHGLIKIAASWIEVVMRNYVISVVITVLGIWVYWISVGKWQRAGELYFVEMEADPTSK